jgi:FkbM family methyltransferase
MADEATVSHFRALFETWDKFRYLLWTVRKRPGTFQGRFRDGMLLRMRPSDWETAYEIFFRRVYRTPLNPADVARIVDLGGNVGYSCLFWGKHYPAAEITAFEPHPLHCRILTENVKLNGLSGRVVLHDAAAGVEASQAVLSDRGIASALVAAPAGDVVPVKIVDFFETIGNSLIDILKIDIEGGEYPILADNRFAELAPRVRYLVMEYHERAPEHLGGDWCEERLRSVGFTVERERVETDIGVIRALRG